MLLIKDELEQSKKNVSVDVGIESSKDFLGRMFEPIYFFDINKWKVRNVSDCAARYIVKNLWIKSTILFKKKEGIYVG